jgi:adenylate cyclase
MKRHLVGGLTLASAPGFAKAVTVPACLVCATPAVSGPIIAAGLVPLAVVLHELLFVLAPAHLLLLVQGFRRHRNPLGLLVGTAGVLLVLNHLLSHYVSIDSLPRELRPMLVPDWVSVVARLWSDIGVGGVGRETVLPGLALLAIAALLDWQARRARERSCAPAEYWRAVLTGSHPGLRQGRRVLGLLPNGPRCRLCNAPFAGVGGALMRVLGKGPSGRNPRFCEDCLARTPLGGAEIELSMLFADVRGSTGLAEHAPLADFAALMNRFYTTGTDVLVRTDALIERFQGDAVIGLYVPGFAGPQHARRAVEAAQELLRAVGQPHAPWLPIGIGVHTGIAHVGMVGSDDVLANLTVLGDAANTAARLASQAAAGEIVLSEQAALAADLDTDGMERRELTLKGRNLPVSACVIRAPG